MLSRVWNSAWTLLVLTNLFWASNIIVGRVVLNEVPAIALSFWRWTGAFTVALWFAWPHLKRDWRALLDEWPLMIVLALTGIAFFNTAAYIGLAGTTALNVLLLQSCLPLIVTFWALVLFRERPSLGQFAGIAISMAGVAFVAAHGSIDALLTLNFHRADLWILAAAAIYGIYIVLLRRRPDVHPLSFMQTAMGLGALMIAPFWFLDHAETRGAGWSWSSIGGIVYMAVFPSFIAYLFFNRGVQLIGGARAGQSTHLMPLFGGVMAVAFLEEEFHFHHIAGAVLVGSGIALGQLTKPAPNDST